MELLKIFAEKCEENNLRPSVSVPSTSITKSLIFSDSYSPAAQKLFLLNPVYLFIRYFRKIILEFTIPSVYFHLLMAAYVIIVLGMGCWMYRKYNTKFLYHV